MLVWTKRIFTPLALGALLYATWKSRVFLATLFITAQIHYLAMTILLLMITHLISPLAVVVGFKSLGVSVPYHFTLSTHLRRLPARYLPGGIWHSVGRMMDFHTYGVRSAHLTVFFLLENMLSISVSFMLGGLGMGYFRTGSDPWGKLGFLVLLGSTLGLIFVPVLLTRFMSKISLRHYVQAIGCYLFLIWPLSALGFVCYLRAFQFGGQWLETGSIYLFSWAVGLITFFAPQGLGVFEVMVGNLLESSLSLQNLIVLIAGFRIFSMSADMLLWGIFSSYRFVQYLQQERVKK